ncbi:hypothetical protein [Lacticaseibacillus daqingensis]|uniref:hypothetical protein n=1 Tax=Lacticaseibacillus daqingensis TaxID=2486014 RepID=UPI000F76CAD1|nr:hypothetical protein [Lacticaseibacillus daqingensis]
MTQFELMPCRWRWTQTAPTRAVQVTARQAAVDWPMPIGAELNLAAIESQAGAPRVVNYLRYALVLDRTTATVAGAALPLTGRRELMVVMKNPSATAPPLLEETFARLVQYLPMQYAQLRCVNVVPVVTGDVSFLRAGTLSAAAQTYGLAHWQRRLVDGRREPVTKRQLGRYDRENARRVGQTVGASGPLSNQAAITQWLAQHPATDVLLATGCLRTPVLVDAYARLLTQLSPLGQQGRLKVLGLAADARFGRNPRPQNPRDALTLVAGTWPLQAVGVQADRLVSRA